MFKELVLEFYTTSGGVKPAQIIFYRQGVSESQFSSVLDEEVRAIREACLSLDGGYQPGITFITLQNGHHTKLFCVDPREQVCCLKHHFVICVHVFVYFSIAALCL